MRPNIAFFSIQTVSSGYDYTIYGKDFREIDGGVYDNPDITIGEAMEAILSDVGIQVAACKVIDYEELQEKAEAAAQEDILKAQAEEKEKLPLISDMTEPEPALNGQSRAGIEETALCYAQAQIDEMGLSDEVELLGARVYGSRSREGMYRDGSDVDVALSYNGSIREDDFFDALHEGSFEIAGIPVDIRPVSAEKTGALEKFLEDAERYLDEKRWQELTGEIVKFSMNRDEDLLGFWDGTAEIETKPIYQAYEIIYNALARSDTGKFQAHLEEIIKENVAGSTAAADAARLLEKITGKRIALPEQDEKISFYVAECIEFPVLGEYHENISTLQEAMELYEGIPSDRMHGVKGIGFCLEDGSIYAGKFELMSGREALTDIINDIPHYKESPLVQKAVADMEEILSGQEPRSVTEVEKEPERHQKPAGDPKAAPEESKTKASARQKAGEKASAAGAGRGASDSRKQSVLNAVRERQAGMKEEKQGQKARARRKAAKKSGMEL